MEEEENAQSAYNPETDEINWDCPCLGGMANGPCGEQFKVAFSCFVHSTAEPKGVDCLEAFKKMNECFKEHPDVYEIADEDEDLEEENEEISEIITREVEGTSGTSTKEAQETSEANIKDVRETSENKPEDVQETLETNIKDVRETPETNTKNVQETNTTKKHER
ncbi:6115_t:CDS:2 [Acaulospora colombiana]|uniref:6115_t:CDS:1 n=1 Tax=Acaulospora colombiana TaxID=27376 RepID=A0ACA9KLY5_9GLOM|nr:6115_t:CDS:2 [Acaulospora colombiana]